MPLDLAGVRSARLIWIGRLGDVLIATPFLAALRRRLPEARISLITGEAGASAARLCAEPDETAVLRRFYHPWDNLSLVARLRRDPCDLLIDLNSSFSRASAALCAVARARTKIAFRRGRGDYIFDRLLPAPAENEHMLDRYARLAAELGLAYEPVPRVRPSPADRAAALKALAGLDAPPGRRLVLIFPGNFKKFDNRWPEEKFAALAEALSSRSDLFPAFLAGPGEESKVRDIVAELSRPLPVLGPLPLGATAALLELSSAVVANATGTAHLAVAVGANLVSVLGRYTRTVWMPKPGRPRHFCAVSESWGSCRDVPVEAVLAALGDALQSLGSAPAGT